MKKLTVNENEALPQPSERNTFPLLEYTEVPGGEYQEDRTEKPWQRVLNKVAKRGNHLKEPVRSVYSPIIIIVLGLYLLLGYLTQLVEDDMPRVMEEAALPKYNSERFSEEAAKRYLGEILGDAPRVSGTKYHLDKTHDLKRLLDSIAAQATIRVTTDWQMVTDDFVLTFSSSFYNIYQNCSNIIALLEGESGFHRNGTLRSSILVNCHYDSVPFAIGASDNGVFCATMAETLSVLSKRSTKLKHNVIFLFNGAEENPLQGSHAFLRHPWAQGVISVINLDSAGMNGKPTVFQVTDPRLLKSYSRAADSPAAQGLAEFLFLSGIIPSDTDFRVFRDFGDIQGIDIAFAKMGHVYHTRNDIPELIQPGVIQSAGDMVLKLVADIADQEDMSYKIESSAAVYYDYLNAFMLTYSFTVSYVVDALIGLLGLTSVYHYLWLVGARRSSMKELLFAALGRLATTLAGVAVSGIFLAVMVATTTQMRYLSRAWLTVPLYWLPYLLTTVATSHAYDMWRAKGSGLSRSLRALQAMAATRLILSVVTLVLVCIPPLTTLRYLFSVTLFLLSVTSLISITVVRCIRLTGWQHLILEVIVSIPSAMWLLSLALRLDATMLPIMGRSSTNSPDYTVGLLNIGLVVLAACAVSGIELLFSRKYLWAVLGALAVPCVVLMFVPFSPYDGDGIALQRHYWFHSQITDYDIAGIPTSQTSGVLVTKQDPYSLDSVVPALVSSGSQLSSRRGFDEECNTKLFCGLPLYRTWQASRYSEAMFLYTGPPAPFTPPPSFRVESKVCSGDTCTFQFVITGGAHNVVTFWPHANVSVSGWSLRSAPKPSFSQGGRPVYALFHSTPTYMERWDYRITVELSVARALQAAPLLEVSHHSSKLHHPQDFTAEYSNLLNSMPKYFNVATILSFRDNYVF